MTKRINTQPEMLLDVDSDTLRHPMWTPPADTDKLGVHIRALRRSIATNLIAFDGRPDYEFVVGYCEEVYDATRQDEHAGNFLWVLGKVEWRRYHWTTRMQAHIDGKGPIACMPRNRPVYLNNIAVIDRLARDFAQAVCKEIA